MAKYISPTVIEDNGRFIPVDPGNRFYKALIASGVPITPYSDPVVQTTQITFAQLLIGLVTEGWITKAEGEAWLAGTLPAPVVALINSLPAGVQFAARARASRPSVVLINDGTVQALAALQGKTAQLPAFFNTYGAV